MPQKLFITLAIIILCFILLVENHRKSMVKQQVKQELEENCKEITLFNKSCIQCYPNDSMHSITCQ